MTTEAQSTREQIEEAAATWIVRRDGEGWTPADAAALEAWLAESVAHRAAFLRLDAVWVKAGRLERVSRPQRYRLLAVAASVVLVVVGALVAVQSGLFRATPVPRRHWRRRLLSRDPATFRRRSPTPASPPACAASADPGDIAAARG